MTTGRFLMIVTGASRGFGRCVAEEFVRKVAPFNPVELVLIARSVPGLKSVASAIDEITMAIPDVSEVVVRQNAFDLGDLERLNARLDGIFSGLDPSRYARAVLVNNAGSLGHIGYANELPSLATLRSEMDFNFTSAMWLSSRFTAVFGVRKSEALKDAPRVTSDVSETAQSEGGEGEHCSAAPAKNTPGAPNNLVVNISSKAAFKPIESWGGYSAGKAGREMFHRVLAMEQAKVGGLKILNYAPGPMATDMSLELISPAQYEKDVQNGKLVDPNISAKKCIRLVLSGKFESGAHIDLFDEDPA